METSKTVLDLAQLLLLSLGSKWQSDPLHDKTPAPYKSKDCRRLAKGPTSAVRTYITKVS